MGTKHGFIQLLNYEIKLLIIITLNNDKHTKMLIQMAYDQQDLLSVIIF